MRTSLYIVAVSLVLVACGNNERKHEIQPAKKPSHDATAVANEAWVLINQLDQLLYEKETLDVDEVIRRPLRELSNRWRVEVRMTDAVTEGKYALCRKSLTSLDIWARSVKENAGDIDKKQAAYEHDKKLCQNAIEHPELGNTSPKVNERP